MLNNITIMGRLTADPELKTTPNGKHVTSFDIAVERDTKGPDGEKYTDFFTVVAWNQSAQSVNRYLGKGQSIIVKGSLQTRAWEDRNGQKRKAVEILMERFYFANSQKTDSTAPTPQQTTYQTPKSPAQPTFANQAETEPAYQRNATFTEYEPDDQALEPFTDDDLPF